MLSADLAVESLPCIISRLIISRLNVRTVGMKKMGKGQRRTEQCIIKTSYTADGFEVKEMDTNQGLERDSQNRRREGNRFFPTPMRKKVFRTS